MLEAIEKYRAYLQQDDRARTRRIENWRERIAEMLRDALFQRVLSYYLSEGEATRYAAEVAEHKRDPYSLVEKIIDEFGETRMNQIDHLGIAVKSLAEARKFYEKLGLHVMPEETVEAEKVRLAMVPIGESRLELLEPTSPDSAIAKVSRQARRGIAPCRSARQRPGWDGRAAEGLWDAPDLGRDQNRRGRSSLRFRAPFQRWRRAAGTGGRRSPGRLTC